MRQLTLIMLSIGFVAGCNILFPFDSDLPIDINGKVYDEDSGSPIPLATIELWGVDVWDEDKLIARTFSSGTIGQTSGAGNYRIETTTTAYNNCDSTGIRLIARQEVHLGDGSTISYRLPGGSIPINCNGDSKHIKRTINLGLERY